jgi:hypothetical protein
MALRMNVMYICKNEYQGLATRVFDIPDIYPYKDPELMELIKTEVTNKL